MLFLCLPSSPPAIPVLLKTKNNMHRLISVHDTATRRCLHHYGLGKRASRDTPFYRVLLGGLCICLLQGKGKGVPIYFFVLALVCSEVQGGYLENGSASRCQTKAGQFQPCKNMLNIPKLICSCRGAAHVISYDVSYLMV